MAALNTDLVRTTAPNFATTLANSMLVSDTSLTLQSAAGLATTTAITLTIDATDPVSGNPTNNLKEVVTGTLSGNVLSNLIRGQDGTTQQAHASGANVVMWWNANMINDFQTSYLTQHKQLGTHTALTTDTITASGNATVSGTLGVTGASTLTGAISGAGYSLGTISNPYKFSVYRNAAQTPASPGLIQFDTKVFDTGSNVDVVTNKGRFAVTINGFYFFSAGMAANIPAGSYSAIYLYKNGALIKLGTSGIGGQAGPFTTSNQVSALIKLVPTDYIEVYSYTSGIALGVGDETLTYFNGYLVSAT